MIRYEFGVNYSGFIFRGTGKMPVESTEMCVSGCLHVLRKHTSPLLFCKSVHGEHGALHAGALPAVILERDFPPL